MLCHGTCVARRAAPSPGGSGGEARWDGVLLLGPPGSGKSDLALRLLARHDPAAEWALVADDQVALSVGPGTATLRAAAPDALRGMLEARGVGVVEGLATLPSARLALAVELAPSREAVPRLPEPRAWTALGASLPLVALFAPEASAPERVALALDAATGAARMRVGAFGPR